MNASHIQRLNKIFIIAVRKLAVNKTTEASVTWAFRKREYGF